MRPIPPEEMRVEVRGSGNATRQINHIIAPEFPAHRLLVVEVLTPAGNWSSYPPHKHEQERLPVENDLEEVYAYRFEAPEAFGVQRLYSRTAAWTRRGRCATSTSCSSRAATTRSARPTATTATT